MAIAAWEWVSLQCSSSVMTWVRYVVFDEMFVCRADHPRVTLVSEVESSFRAQDYQRALLERKALTDEVGNGRRLKGLAHNLMASIAVQELKSIKCGLLSCSFFVQSVCGRECMRLGYCDTRTKVITARVAAALNWPGSRLTVLIKTCLVVRARVLRRSTIDMDNRNQRWSFRKSALGPGLWPGRMYWA